jgi:hypothetical protein
MRIIELSNHPAAMLREAQARREAAAATLLAAYEANLAATRDAHRQAIANHEGRLAVLAEKRAQLRLARHPWRAIRASRRLSDERSRRPSGPTLPARPILPSVATREEEKLAAGIAGEQGVAAGLGSSLTDSWTLFGGYRNRGGEIDCLLVGPRGLFAFECKHRRFTVQCVEDDWRYDRFDNHGNLVEQGQLTDRSGRSPSQQVNVPADQLERFLASRGHPLTIKRIVLLTHPRAALGACERLTVDLIATSTNDVLEWLGRETTAIDASQQAKLEQLITRDHRFHQQRQRTSHARRREPARAKGDDPRTHASDPSSRTR